MGGIKLGGRLKKSGRSKDMVTSLHVSTRETACLSARVCVGEF